MQIYSEEESLLLRLFAHFGEFSNIERSKGDLTLSPFSCRRFSEAQMVDCCIVYLNGVDGDDLSTRDKQEHEYIPPISW